MHKMDQNQQQTQYLSRDSYFYKKYSVKVYVSASPPIYF